MLKIKIFYENNDFNYEIDKLTGVFFPNYRLESIKGSCDGSEPSFIVVSRTDGSVSVRVCVNDFCEESEKQLDPGDDAELEAALLLFSLLTKATGVTPPWGVLTGVRPIKLFRRLTQEGGQEYAVRRFTDVFRVSPEKTALAAETEKNEGEILKKTTPLSFSLYISVPFCPSRCSYCSFVSASTERTKHLIEPYTQLLCRELEATADIASRLGLKLESVYMGGGTPTTLDADQLSRVLRTVRRRFDMSGCREFTVEAGRPDTITSQKLLAMKSAAVDRISINPQTLNDEVLKLVGRRHTAADIFDCFAEARECGFDHINMDLIAGLPGDTSSGFEKTLDGITDLSPESITIHTLSMKRASRLTQEGLMINRQEAEEAAKMLSYADKKLHACGYAPYYLYRQSRMVGNLENTGWSKPGKEGYYNVFIMDETQTILACGAGAVTKLSAGMSEIERIFNYKYPYEYLDRFDELIARKEGIERFYDKFR